jgi:hypothetical protein
VHNVLLFFPGENLCLCKCCSRLKYLFKIIFSAQILVILRIYSSGSQNFRDTKSKPSI